MFSIEEKHCVPFPLVFRDYFQNSSDRIVAAVARTIIFMPDDGTKGHNFPYTKRTIIIIIIHGFSETFLQINTKRKFAI